MDLEKILQERYDRESFVSLATNILQVEPCEPVRVKEESEKIDEINLIGEKYIGSRSFCILEVKLKNTVLERSPVFQRDEVFKYLNGRGSDAALVAYYKEDETVWKIALVTITYCFDKNGKIKVEYSEAKRFWYIVGKGKPTHTAQQQLSKLLNKENSYEDILNAFSIEPVTKAFYQEIANWYFWTLKHVKFPNDAEKITGGRNIAVIRFITRIMFIWFMKHKGLINDELFDVKKIQDLLRDFSERSCTYYKAILQNLFFATLNTPIVERDFRTEKRVRGSHNEDYMNHGKFRHQKLFKNPEQLKSLFNYIPFLNGGLFECLDKKKNDPSNNTGKEIRIDGFSDVAWKQPVFPNLLFFSKEQEEVNLNEDYGTNNKKYLVRGIIKILESYNFTVEESTPVDQEVALDPELLGKVFENLLASYNPETATTARKATGSYYTPREVVNYMVDESLKKYFETKTKGSIENFDKKLENLFSYASDVNLFTEAETDLLIQSIESLKVIDPAVGSGAFPMAILQRLVFLLSKLDPHNTKWKAQQVKAIEGNVKDPNLKNELIEDIKSNFKDNELDYGRKLYLIQKCLYGVDIQTIAIQIAKLRFFISLLVDEKVNPDDRDHNYGIKPLPNLETKLVVANSLIDLFTSSGMRSSAIVNKEQEIQGLLSTYFNTHIEREKENIKKEYGEKVKQIKQDFEKERFYPEVTEKITKYDPFDVNTPSDWFDPEWMFGVREGFDIVIANPPYSQLQKAIDSKNKVADLYKNQKNKNYTTFERTGDIYCLFYEKGIKLLKPNGILAYITSNKWMRAGYGEKLREYFRKQNPLVLIDLGPNVFESATVDTNILVIQKAINKNNLIATTINENKKDNIDIAGYVKNNAVILTKLTKDAWFIGSDAEQRLKEKIERIGKPLKKWDVKIYRGVLTGLNEAFIITTEKRDEILANCRGEDERKRTEAIIKPILRGRDIKRYYYEWAGLWVIFIPWHFPLHEDYSIQGASEKAEMEFKNLYPSIYGHLLEFKDLLASRNKAETGIRYEWYALQRCAATYYPEFEKEKVVYSEIVRQPQFYFDTDNFYVEATSFLMTGNYAKYICGLLNSNPIAVFFKQWYAGGGLADEGYRYKKAFLENLPLPPITPSNQPIVRQIELLVDKILAITKDDDYLTNSTKQAKVKEYESQIDQLVYKLYSLTEEEMKIIEKYEKR